jgi:NO-binding membrane sensor protein with MHYT domain
MPGPAVVLATIAAFVAVALLERLVLTTPRRRRVGTLLGAGAILAWILVLPFTVTGE